LAARQLGQPAFPEAPWLRDRPKLIASLKEANTRPATLAGRAFAKAVYGLHPYGYESTESTLNRIAVADMRALHASALKACAAKVSVVGALSRAQADALVTTLLAQLPAGSCDAMPTVAEVEPLQAASEQRIAFASAQAQVLLGQPGFKRNSPDFFALTVGNHILGGGGFTARLTEEVREKRGLTYSVYSYFSPGMHAGAFTVGLQTRPDQAQQALDLVREVLARFVKDGPTEKELQAAKDNLIGGFALRLDSNKKLLDNVAKLGSPAHLRLAFDLASDSKLPPEQAAVLLEKMLEAHQFRKVQPTGELSAVAELAASQNEALAVAAIEAAAAWQVTSAVETLEKLAGSPQQSAARRRACITALGHLSGDAAHSALKALAQAN
jgi:predicted Zn-dependent peptidase